MFRVKPFPGVSSRAPRPRPGTRELCDLAMWMWMCRTCAEKSTAEAWEVVAWTCLNHRTRNHRQRPSRHLRVNLRFTQYVSPPHVHRTRPRRAKTVREGFVAFLFYFLAVAGCRDQAWPSSAPSTVFTWSQSGLFNDEFSSSSWRKGIHLSEFNTRIPSCRRTAHLSVRSPHRRAFASFTFRGHRSWVHARADPNPASPFTSFGG